MGDLVGDAVAGTLYYLPYSEFERVRGSEQLSKFQRVKIVADMCRLNTLYMIARAGSGHIGSSFSSMEIFTWLLMEELDLSKSSQNARDVFFSSKGHDAPGYYAVQMALGRLPFDQIHKLRRIDGLPGHPDIATPGIVTNTGSLGMGVSKAKGMAIANRLAKRNARIFVLTGDGELQEGQFWESLVSAVNSGLHEITVIIDHNKLQSDTFIKNVSDLGDLEGKLRAFGWRVERCDGNNIEALASTIASLHGERRPQVIIADTVKGKGVSFMEHTSLDSDVAMYRFHSGAPTADAYRTAVQELVDRLQLKISEYGLSKLEFKTSERDAFPQPSGNLQRLIPAYTEALLEQAKIHPNMVALDADLVLDTGLIPFREKFPDRFIECGIAEQDMVSIAGGLALNGFLPVVHSFACFLSSRPNEQIYNNSTEKTKIIYVGSLAGVLPGGPGHSHQAVRDISSLAAIPGLIMMEPSCEAEVGMLLNWCVNKNQSSSYIRLISLPWPVTYQLPDGYQSRLGHGITLLDGHDITVIAYGPILLSAAIEAAGMLYIKQGISVKVINLPWLNYVDASWLREAIGSSRYVHCIDNHYAIGGQGELIASCIATWGSSITVHTHGLKEVPPSGTNDQVLDSVRLDAKGIAQVILDKFTIVTSKVA